MHQVLLWVSAAPFLQAGCLELSAVHWYSCVLESFYSVLPHTHTNSCYSSFRIINPILCCCSDLGTSSLGTCTSSLGTSSVLVTFSWNTHLKPQLLRSKTLAWNLHIICGDSTYLASSLEDHRWTDFAKVGDIRLKGRPVIFACNSLHCGLDPQMVPVQGPGDLIPHVLGYVGSGVFGT